MSSVPAGMSSVPAAIVERWEERFGPQFRSDGINIKDVRRIIVEYIHNPPKWHQNKSSTFIAPEGDEPHAICSQHTLKEMDRSEFKIRITLHECMTITPRCNFIFRIMNLNDTAFEFFCNRTSLEQKPLNIFYANHSAELCWKFTESAINVHRISDDHLIGIYTNPIKTAEHVIICAIVHGCTLSFLDDE